MAAGSRPTEPVNFLLIVTDQQRADYLGCEGHPVLRTRHLDELARRGLRFTDAHVASPVCMPNRASLMTGRYPSVHGARHNGLSLSQRALTFVELLRASGYATALVGKSHLQPMTGLPPLRKPARRYHRQHQEAWQEDDFDDGQELPARWEGDGPSPMRLPFYGFEHVDMVTGHGDDCGGQYLRWLRAQTPEADRLRDRAHQLPHDYRCPQAWRTPLPEDLYPTFYIRDQALRQLRAQAQGRGQTGRPFFTCVSFPDPHHPFTPPGRYWDLYRPQDMPAPLPFEAHRNPPPHLRAVREEYLAGRRQALTQRTFAAEEREIREAMALTCGMIHMIDDAVGALVDELARIGELERTVIVFTSDHGDYLGAFGLMLKGAALLRSVTRMPLIWTDPSAAPQAPTCDALASTIDLAATILARAGVDPYHGLQGRVLPVPGVQADPPRPELLVEFEDVGARMGFADPANARALLTPEHRLTLYHGQPWGELYDRRADPLETHNLWDDPTHRHTLETLQRRLIDAMLAAGETSPLPRYLA